MVADIRPYVQNRSAFRNVFPQSFQNILLEKTMVVGYFSLQRIPRIQRQIELRPVWQRPDVAVVRQRYLSAQRPFQILGQVGNGILAPISDYFSAKLAPKLAAWHENTNQIREQSFHLLPFLAGLYAKDGGILKKS
jgi:hypothetical protein